VISSPSDQESKGANLQRYGRTQVLEYLAAEVIELAGNASTEFHENVISSRGVMLAARYGARPSLVL
jgi:hypothetical protein